MSNTVLYIISGIALVSILLSNKKKIHRCFYKHYLISISVLLAGLGGGLLLIINKEGWFEDFKLNIAAELAGVILTIILINYLYDYVRKRKKETRWDPVKEDVLRLLNSEIKALFFDLNFMYERPAITYWGELTEKEIDKLFFDRLEELSQQEFIKISPLVKEKILKDRKFHKLFIKRKEKFDNIELKYSEYLSPKIIKSLIRIQRGLESIYYNMGIAKKEFDDFKEKRDYPIEAFLDKFFKDLGKNLAWLLKEIYSLNEELRFF